MSSEILGFQTYMWSHSTFQLIHRARSDLHRHGALQVTLGVENPLRMGTGSQPHPSDVTGRAILVAANQQHWFESDGWAAALWLEPESRVGRLFADTFLSSSPIVALPTDPLERVWPELIAMTTSVRPAAEALEVRRALESAWFEDAPRARPLPPGPQEGNPSHSRSTRDTGLCE